MFASVSVLFLTFSELFFLCLSFKFSDQYSGQLTRPYSNVSFKVGSLFRSAGRICPERVLSKPLAVLFKIEAYSKNCQNE